MGINFEIVAGMLAVRGGACLGMIHDMIYSVGPFGCTRVLVDFTNADGEPSQIILSPARIMVA